MVHKRSFIRANTIFSQHLHRLVSPAEVLRLTRTSQNTSFKFEFVHLRLWCTNEASFGLIQFSFSFCIGTIWFSVTLPLGQIKFHLNFRIISGTKVLAKLLSRSVSSCCCVYATRTGHQSADETSFKILHNLGYKSFC